MKAIVVAQDEWDQEFEITEQSLSLTRFAKKDATASPAERTFIESMHRAFHYELHMLKKRLEER